VTAWSTHHRLQEAALLLGHLYRVKPAPADVEGEAPELAQGVANTVEQPDVLLDQEPR
jgi:hypothetical protein